MVNSTSRISLVKKAVIERSSLTEDQKRAAAVSLDKCMSTNMTLPSMPPPRPRGHPPLLPFSEKEMHGLMNGYDSASATSSNIFHPLVMLKLVMCSAKALVQNVSLDLIFQS